MPIKKLTPAFSLERERMRSLEDLIPEAFADGEINWETLKEALSEYIEEEGHNAEYFGLFWHGKRDARRLASIPSKGALAPAPGEGVEEEKSENIFIEGDNLEVLKLLQKSYSGRIKMIYIDPPYNTGQDFIYKDDYSEPLEVYLRKTGQMGEGGELLTTNTKADGRFHTNWLNMLYPRLRLARNLLRDDGVIFVSIDDNEIHNLRQVMNEIFGEENFVSEIVIQSNKRGQTYKDIAKTHEYLLLYSRGDEPALFELPKEANNLPYEDANGRFDLWELRNRNPKFGRHNRPNLYFPIYVAPKLLDSNGYAKVSLLRSEHYSVEVFPQNSAGEDGCWRWGKEKIGKSDLESDLPVLVGRQKRTGGWNIYEKSRKSTTKAKSLWDETSMISEQGTIELGYLGLAAYFDHPKPVGLIKKALQISTEADDIVLDFFAGSCTTAQATFDLNSEDDGNRHFICVQLPEQLSGASGGEFETIADVSKERIRRAGRKVKDELASKLKLNDNDPDLGFRVFKLQISNFKAWQDYHGENPDEIANLFTQFETPLVDGWNEPGVLSELLLLEGFPFDSNVNLDPDFKLNRVFRIESDTSTHHLYISLDMKIADGTIRAVAGLSEQDIFICYDSALTDTAKVQLTDVGNVRTI